MLSEVEGNQKNEESEKEGKVGPSDKMTSSERTKESFPVRSAGVLTHPSRFHELPRVSFLEFSLPRDLRKVELHANRSGTKSEIGFPRTKIIRLVFARMSKKNVLNLMMLSGIRNTEKKGSLLRAPFSPVPPVHRSSRPSFDNL